MECCKNNPIEDNRPWTAKDQSELEILEAEIIQMCDTEIGRQTKKVVDHALPVLPKNVKISTKNSKKRNSFKSVNRSTSRRSLNIKRGVCSGSQTAFLVWGSINKAKTISCTPRLFATFPSNCADGCAKNIQLVLMDAPTTMVLSPYRSYK